MQKADPPLDKWRNVLFFLTALLVILADQFSKFWVRSNLTPGESLPETGLFRLTHVHNTGAAFGLFQDQSLPLAIVALIGVVAILIFVLFFSHRLPILNNWLSKLALGLVLGGASGNLIDRIRQGYVTDFIDIGIWPAFNVADSSVVVGVILFAYSLLFLARVEQKE